jgi:hypothetical protein
MAVWEFWKGVASGVLGTVLASLSCIVAVKSLWPKRAKPNLLKIDKCIIDSLGCVCIELLINNSGPKDCSLISIDLDWPKKSFWEKDSTFIPKKIVAYSTERIVIYGSGVKGMVSGNIMLAFDTKKNIKTEVIFTTSHL